MYKLLKFINITPIINVNIEHHKYVMLAFTYKIVKISNKIVKNQKIKIILTKCITKKYRCPNCNKRFRVGFCGK